jgi:hypothetical protein
VAESRSRVFGFASLVAGDVTGGGGKATTPKTKRHRFETRKGLKSEICEN